MREKSAVIIGPIAIVTRTLATVVSVRATMKAVNITAQNRLEAHSTRLGRNSPRHMPVPRRTVRPMASASALNRLRQNVTSKLRAASRWRVTTPAMLHSRVTSTINATARR